MKKLFFIALILLFILSQPLTLEAPMSDLSKTLNLIYYSCYLLDVPVRYELALFSGESEHFVGVTVCEKKFKNCRIKSYGVPQLTYAAAEWTGYTGSEIDLEKSEIAIPWATAYIKKCMRIYKKDLSKVSSVYKTGRPCFKSYYRQILKVENKIK